MTRVYYEPENYRLMIRGHAGAGQFGEDLVCAGISTLGWTLIRAALMRDDYHAAYRADDGTGVIDVRCEPEETAREACRVMFETIAGGLELIADMEPEHVTFERSE